MTTSDPEILSRIGDLVDRSGRLRERHSESPLDDQERAQLEEMEIELDQCWDLLNQRRALREFGMDPARLGSVTTTRSRATAVTGDSQCSAASASALVRWMVPSGCSGGEYSE